MVAKLRAYRLQDNYKSINTIIILSNLQAVTTHDVYYRHFYTDSQIQGIEQIWGIIGRRVYGTTVAGKKSYATCTSIDFEEQIIRTSLWSDGVPFHSNLSVYRLEDPLTFSLAQTLDVSEDIIEDTLKIIRQIESLNKFDLRVSRASFSLNGTTDITTLLNKYWNSNGFESHEYFIVVEIEGYFYGISDYDNINYDEVEKTYHFDAYDPTKWLQKYVWGNKLPSLGSDFRNISGFLLYTCNLFFYEGKQRIIDVDGGQYWDNDFVSIWDGSEWQPMDYYMNIMDMMVEIMKHYGATLYFDAGGNLNFTKRIKKNITDYDESVMLEELNKSYEGHEYSGILISAKGEWQYDGTSWTQWEGNVLVWEADGELQSTVINPNLSNIPKNFSYLDLRQELPEKVTWDWSLGGSVHYYRMFMQRTREEVYNDYKELMRSSALYETTLNGIDYQIYDTISIGGESYTMNYLEIDFNEQSTHIRCYKSL